MQLRVSALLFNASCVRPSVHPAVSMLSLGALMPPAAGRESRRSCACWRAGWLLRRLAGSLAGAAPANMLSAVQVMVAQLNIRKALARSDAPDINIVRPVRS